jgi:hypothetical protein
MGLLALFGRWLLPFAVRAGMPPAVRALLYLCVAAFAVVAAVQGPAVDPSCAYGMAQALALGLVVTKMLQRVLQVPFGGADAADAADKASFGSFVWYACMAGMMHFALQETCGCSAPRGAAGVCRPAGMARAQDVPFVGGDDVDNLPYNAAVAAFNAANRALAANYERACAVTCEVATWL